MSKTSALYAADPGVGRAVFDDIENMFRLTKEDLVQITTHFLKDFELGLSEYNHPMAMMYAPLQIALGCYSSLALASPTFVTGVPNGSEVGYVFHILAIPVRYDALAHPWVYSTSHILVALARPPARAR